MKKFNYIDLYSGIGGFKFALDKLGGNCIFSSEIDKYAIETYVLNHGEKHRPTVGMDEFKEKDIEEIKNMNFFSNVNVDLIAAGFPCQTFSIAGNRKGFDNNDVRGTQFFNLLKLIESLKPKIIILENVKNLKSHDNGMTFKIIKDLLNFYEYNVFEEILSPLDIGVPQNRDRIFILAVKSNIPFSSDKFLNKNFNKNVYKKLEDLKIIDFGNEGEGIKITKENTDAIRTWELFVNEWLKNRKEDEKSIPALWLEEMFDESIVDENLPEWKKNMIKKMRVFYSDNKSWIDIWYKKHGFKLNKRIHRKLEWNAGINFKPKETIVVIRQSGVRFKKPDYFPALVAVVDIPVIYDHILNKWRNISVNEMIRLQSYDEFKFKFDVNKNKLNTYSTIYKQLGNSVNVKLVYEILKGVIEKIK